MVAARGPAPRTPSYDMPESGMTVRRIVLATTNYDKVGEIRDILAGLPLTLLTLDSFPKAEAPEETGGTFEENARAKALYYAKSTGEVVVAEDSGLEIDAMNGAPGVESARFGGVESTYPEKFTLIYDALGAKGLSTSPARFVCALALIDGEQVLFEAKGTVEGTIAPEPRGAGGFGYDPIFFFPPFGCTLAEASDRKAQVSHRGQAFRSLRVYLEARLQASGSRL